MRNAIAETVKELRKENHISQEKLAELIESHQVYISEIEKAKKLPSVEHIYKIAKAFGMKFSDFAKLVEEKFENNKKSTTPTQGAGY